MLFNKELSIFNELEIDGKKVDDDDETTDYTLDDDNTDLINYMRDDKASVVCINDTDRAKNFDKAIKQVQKVFDEKLNEKCSFEK